MSGAAGGAGEPPARGVLVTGAGGYVGRQLVAALAREPGRARGVATDAPRVVATNDARVVDTNDVRVVDTNDARVVATDVRLPAESERVPGVVYETADVRRSDFAALLRRHGCDRVVHLAAIVTPGLGSTRAAEYEVDVTGTRRVVDACLAAGARQLVYTSSGAAYGYHADNPEWLGEEAPLRGNPEFAYADHKRQVEELLARVRREHPELRQLVLRAATILGDRADNQITRLFEGRFVLGVAGSAAPFVLVWDEDVVGAILHGIRSDAAGVFNLAGDGTLSLREMARRLGKPYVPLPPALLALGLRAGRALGLTAYGPEQLGFLRYRPVLANDRLKRELGYTPRKSTSEVFDAFVAARASRRAGGVEAAAAGPKRPPETGPCSGAGNG